jgi:hypothetical protein
MFVATKKKKSAPKAEELEVKTEDVQETVQEEATEEVAEAPAVEKFVLDVLVFRDEEGRLVAQIPKKEKRIAGTDDAFPEVLRQLGAEIIKERLI